MGSVILARRVLLLAWLVSASGYPARAAAEGAADPAASLLSKVLVQGAGFQLVACLATLCCGTDALSNLLKRYW